MKTARSCPGRSATVLIRGFDEFLSKVGAGHSWTTWVKLYIDNACCGTMTSDGIQLAPSNGPRAFEIRFSWTGIQPIAEMVGKAITIQALSLEGYPGMAVSCTPIPNGTRSNAFTAENHPVVYDPLLATNGGDATELYTIGKMYQWSYSGIPASTKGTYFAPLAPFHLGGIALKTIFTVCGLSREFNSMQSNLFSGPPTSMNYGRGGTSGSSGSSSNSGSPYNPPSSPPNHKTAMDTRNAVTISIPNVDGDLVSVRIDDDAESAVTNILTDLLGKLVLKDEMLPDIHRPYHIRISMLGIPSGIYPIRAEGAAGVLRTAKVWKR